ncbi:PIG-L deacetylase family protein [Streptomyces sp. NPDC006333]|uniref:PIG-L deacetylase family protein n=1 Tax=Streptomyces sp. NPDC006333 TaxID=3156753 RepID=UPI0033A040A5
MTLAPTTERVVAVVAHPDDAELMCYGTLRRYQQLGAVATVVTVTRGASGISLADTARGRRLDAGARWQETRQAWQDTGVEVTCLGLPDGALCADRALISRVEAELVRLGCTTLITHSPSGANDHQDHRALGQAASNAATRVPSCHTVLYGQPHAPRNGFDPTVLVDIGPFLDAKVQALSRHATQGGRWYLSEDYTRHRAADAAWRLRPALAAQARACEAFETPLISLLHQHAHPGEQGKRSST